MPPPSKHGLDRKFKPWRKGKSASKVDGAKGSTLAPAHAASAGGGGGNASLRNRLRGQRRFLAKLTSNDSSNIEAIAAVKNKISQFEKDIELYEQKEQEKKNSAKYHQVKFIERQKLTRLEKSVQRQLHQIQENQQSNNDSKNEEKITQLQTQLQSIAMDQLYIAFFPPNTKYISLFKNGMERVIDDENNQNRRKGVWSCIRDGLLKELKEEKKKRSNITKEKNKNDDESDAGSDSSSSVPSDSSSDSGNESDGKNNDIIAVSKERKIQLSTVKTWVNLDAAKEALLSMPPDTYPNAPSLVTGSSAPGAKTKAKKTQDQMKPNSATNQNNTSSATGERKGSNTPVADGRFVLSKEQDGLFHESTTGNDYHKEIVMEKKGKHNDEGKGGSDSDSDSDDDSSSSEDDADPLKGFHNPKGTVSTAAAGNAPKPQSRSDSDSSSDSSSSESSNSGAKSNKMGPSKLSEIKSKLKPTKEHASSSSSSSSSDDSDSLDSDSDAEDGKHDHQQKEECNKDHDEHDDFFTTEKVSTEDIFAQVRRQHDKKRHANEGDDLPFQQRKPDKSKGFGTQKQRPGQFKAYQSRQKRMKFG